jgi:hypothetical protein
VHKTHGRTSGSQFRAAMAMVIRYLALPPAVWNCLAMSGRVRWASTTGRMPSHRVLYGWRRCVQDAWSDESQPVPSGRSLCNILIGMGTSRLELPSHVESHLVAVVPHTMVPHPADVTN